MVDVQDPSPPGAAPNGPAPGRGYGFASPLRELLQRDQHEVLGRLQEFAARRRWAATEHEQVLAWQESLRWLAEAAREIASANLGATWHLCLEYQIPRRGGRIDAVLIAQDLLFVLEFKSRQADTAARRQAEDYGLELMDFHEASQGRRIFPVVCAAEAQLRAGSLPGDFGVATVSTCPPGSLSRLLQDLFQAYHQDESQRTPIDAEAWLQAPYAPTPMILEAARALYAGHQVRELSTSKASAAHLERSFAAVTQVIDETLQRGDHTLCLLTGIPGAGKTLAGLNVVHNAGRDVDATFLSGNGPLVQVMQEVLATDLADRTSITKTLARRQAKTLVTNVHGWLEEYVDRQPQLPPRENVVVFDEAQRAWSREHSKRKFNRDASEPEMMLEVLSRRESAVLVALVGEGQEINTGEAGLSEWGRALTGKFADWRIAVAPDRVTGGPGQAGSPLLERGVLIAPDRIQRLPDLHLAVGQRTYRAQALTEWVEAVLASRPDEAALLMEELQHYPVVMTRDLERARAWLRKSTRGLRRCGLLAGSGSRRLRPHGIAVQERAKEVDWFLRSPEDVRSSNFLELALSEFGIQGLEVDWSCVAWGGDLTRKQGSWDIRRFRGTTWQQVRTDEDRRYAINRYRVLLTRAREGMVLWIPNGHPEDPTRDPACLNAVEEYLSACGARSV